MGSDPCVCRAFQEIAHTTRITILAAYLYNYCIVWNRQINRGDALLRLRSEGDGRLASSSS